MWSFREVYTPEVSHQIFIREKLQRDPKKNACFFKHHFFKGEPLNFQGVFLAFFS